MNYLNCTIQKMQEVADSIYSAFFEGNYAFAGISNYNSQSSINIGDRKESWLENACFSHDGSKKGVPRSKGNTRLHHASKVVEGVNIGDRTQGESLQEFLKKKVGPSRAKQILKHYK
jgi:hypothetical protein